MIITVFCQLNLHTVWPQSSVKINETRLFTVLDNVLELWNKFTSLLRIKRQKSCAHVHAYRPHNILWRAACGPRAVNCPSLWYYYHYTRLTALWIILKQETVSGSGISWAICKSAPCSRQITTPAPHHSDFYKPDALTAAQPTASKHWRQHCIYLRMMS